jgi:hypothetical protein
MEATHSQGKLSRSWALIKSSFHVLKLDKELVSLPIIEFIVSLGVLVAIGIVSISIFWGINGTLAGLEDSDGLVYLTVVVLVVLTTFIANLFSGAIIHAALKRFDGGDPTAIGSLKAVWKKRGSIFRFSLLAAGVVLILDAIRQRVPFGGRLLTWLGEAAWTVASFFVIPFIVSSENKLGPIESTKKSLNLIKQVWGESLAINVGIGLIAFLTMVSYSLVVAFVFVSLVQIGTIVGLVFGGFALIGLLTLALVFNVISSIAKAAVFYWATTGKAPATFDKELLRVAMTHKKARKVFTV